MCPVREPDVGNPQVRFDEGDVETESWVRLSLPVTTAPHLYSTVSRDLQIGKSCDPPEYSDAGLAGSGHSSDLLPPAASAECAGRAPD